MGVETAVSNQPVSSTGLRMLVQDSRVRVFVLSNLTLLREGLARVLKRKSNISLFSAQEFSLSAIAESVESTCNVLLVDPLNTNGLYSQIFDQLEDAFPNLRIVTMDKEANIADLISAIASV